MKRLLIFLSVALFSCVSHAQTFGPSFEQEIRAANLGELPFAWNSNGEIFGRENLTTRQNAALDAVIAAHDPNAEPDYSAIDQDTLNRVLSENGSVVRALGELIFREINKLRVRAGLAEYTRQQFRDAMKAEMRD